MWRKPLDWEEKQVQAAEVVILEERCKGCGLCVAFCPRGVLQLSKKFNKKGYHPPYIEDASMCAGCNFCEEVCPEFAIFSAAK